MSIDDREWFARETLRRLGIRADGEAGPPPGAGPFNINWACPPVRLPVCDVLLWHA